MKLIQYQYIQENNTPYNIKLWQHTALFFISIFLIAGILFELIALISPRVEKKNGYHIIVVDFYKTVRATVKKQWNKPIIINWKDFKEIFVHNMLHSIFLYFGYPLIILILLKKIKNRKLLMENRYLLVISIVAIYISFSLLFAHAYLGIYKYYPVTKFSAIKLLMGLTIFYGIFEIGSDYFMSFKFVNFFIFIYLSLPSRSLDFIYCEATKKYKKMLLFLPLLILFLFLGALVEATESLRIFKYK